MPALQQSPKDIGDSVPSGLQQSPKDIGDSIPSGQIVADNLYVPVVHGL